MADLIERHQAIDLFPNDDLEWDTLNGYIAPHVARRMIVQLPSAQPEATYEQVKEYCRRRCLSIVDNGFLAKYASLEFAQPEIIKCKDCAMRYSLDTKNWRPCMNHIVPDHFSCCKAVRKTDGKNLPE